MRIGLDARTVYRAHRRGTGKNLIDLYKEVARLRPDWRVIAYHRAPRLDHPLSILMPPTVGPKRIELPGDRVDAWLRWRLPIAAWRDQVDVLHCPANECPGWLPVPTVVTVHDLIPLDDVAQCPLATQRRYASQIRTACDKAAMITTPSQHTKDQLTCRFNANPDRIAVNPWAADSRMMPVAPQRYERVLSKVGVSRPFVLHLGAGEPRKNTLQVLQAWAMNDLARAGLCQLLVIGLDDAARLRFSRIADQLGISRFVRLTGFADEADMASLFTAAEVILYPSLAEGFGLPVLDAWATRTPIIISDQTSLPEVAGDAAVQVDPTDHCGIARTITRVLRDKQGRMALVRRGAQRLSQFTWTATAERFIATMEQVAAMRPARRQAA